MKKLLAVLLLAFLAVCFSLPAGGEEAWEEECSPTLEDQIIEMAWWVTDVVEARGAGDYDTEGFTLERIKGYSVEMFPDEVTWAYATLGDLYAEGLYLVDEESEDTERDMAVYCYEQARSVYEENESLWVREDDRYLDFQAALALKLGKIYVSPEWGLMDYEKAMTNLDFATRFSSDKEQEAEAEYRLGLIYADEASGMLDMRMAKGYLLDAAWMGNEDALAKLKELYGDDAYEWAMYYDWVNDFERVIQLLIPAAEQGDVRAMEYLGYLYYAGLTRKDAIDNEREAYREPEKACFWYTKAAEAGSAESMERLISAYVSDVTNGNPPLIDEETAVAWAMKAIEGDNAGRQARVMLDLGRLCQFKKEYERAETWYTQAEAWLWLGRMYRDEEEIRDYEKATAYLLKEVENSEGTFDSLAAAELRELYLDPDFGPVEYDKQAALYKLAYSKGFTNNLYDLALLYLDPRYGMQDMEQGMYWMYRAASAADGMSDEERMLMRPGQKQKIEQAKAWFEALDANYAGTEGTK